MSEVLAPGRREENKAVKLARITIAAKKLLKEKGASRLTTAEVAHLADVAVGTLFLYAKTKGELLLLAQNSDYRDALDRGIADSERSGDVRSALEALWAPVVHCNRKRVENGRAYLREVMFGDTAEANHAEALRLMGETEAQTAALIEKHLPMDGERAAAVARLVASAALTSLANPASIEVDSTLILNEIIASAEIAIGA